MKKPPIDLVQWSPNFSERGGAKVTTIVLHNTAGGLKGAVQTLCDPNRNASAHLVIGRDGTTVQLVPFDKKAWHAGVSSVNAASIGIEIEATESQRGMTVVQEQKVIAWCKYFCTLFGLKLEDIKIHRWFSQTDCPSLIWNSDAKFVTWRKVNFGENPIDQETKPVMRGIQTIKKGARLQLSKNFNQSEFDCHCSECTETVIDFDHVNNLQMLRNQLGKPIHITSGYRCIDHNAAVGGEPNSYHTRGQATDIYVDDMAPSEVAFAAEWMDGVGRYETFTHVDSRGYQSRW